MAVAIVQEAHQYESGTGDTAVATLGSNFTNGNKIFAWVMENTGSGPSVNAPDGSWTEVTDSVVGPAGNLDGAWYWRAAGASEGNTVTVTITGSTSLGLQVYELSGAGTPGTAVVSSVVSNTALASGSVTGTSDGMVLAGFGLSGLPGGSRSYSNSYVDDVSANVRTQAAHRTVAGSTSTTLTTTNSTNKISSIFNVPAESAADATPTPSTVTTTTTIGTPVVSAGADVAPATVVTTTTIGTPTVVTAGNATVTPVSVATTTTIATVEAETSTTAEPTTVATTTTITTPAVVAEITATVAPAVVTTTTAIGTPVVDVPENTTVVVTTVATTTTIHSPVMAYKLLPVTRNVGHQNVEARGIQRRLMRHMTTFPRGVNVYILNDGTVTETAPDGRTVTWDDVAHPLYGGHDNPVTPDEAALLIAAGYSVEVS